jgi:GAF domain-containing protein/ActR/RegA family two-component response regulator
MSEQTIRVLLLDDEESLRKHLSTYLRDTHGLAVDAVADGNAAMRLIEEMQGRYDVALVDEVLPEGPSGLEVLRAIKAKYPDIEVILFTGWGRQAGMEALRAGAYRYFTKLVDKDELAMTIRFAAEQKRLRRERDYMAALVKASQALTQTTHLDEQLNLVWNFVREQLATPTCFVALYDPQTDILRFPLSYDEGEPIPLPDLTLGGDQANWGLAGYVVKTGQEQVWFTREQKEKDWQNLGIKSRLSRMGPSESGIYFPLGVGDKVLGALSVQSYKPYAFDQALLNAVRALGNQVAVALENSRLFTEAEHKARNLETLQNLAVAINSTLDLDQVLTRTCQAAVELTGADHSGLVLFDPDLATGKVIAEFPATERTLEQIIAVHGIPAEERLVFEQQVINIADLSKDTSLGSVRDLFLGLDIRSVLIVPVIFSGKVVASFSIDSIREPRVFSQSEIEISQGLANQVAVAIRNARLYQETRVGRDYLRSLYQATTEIISPRDPSEVLQHIVDTACRATGAWRAVALLVDESERPRILASSGFEQHLDAATSMRSKGISLQVIESGQPRFISDTEAELDQVHPAIIEQGVKAAACLPLTLMGKNVGVLWIHFREKHAFSKTEQQALQLYANQSTIAYDNARRMRQLEQLRIAAEATTHAAESKEVLQQIARSAARVLEADYAIIWSYDQTRKVFFPEELVAENVPDDLLSTFRQEEPKPGRTTERVLQDGYVIVEDLDTAQADFLGEPTRGFLDALGVKSFQSIRLDVAGEPLGVLYVDYKHERGFGEEDHRILEHFASHAALALKKARLYEQVRRSRDAARAIASVSTLGKTEETLDAIVKGALVALHCDTTTLYTFDEDTQRFVNASGIGYRDHNNIQLPEEINPDSVLRKVINLKERYYHLSEDVPNDELLKGSFVRKEEIESALAIQLRFGKHRVGVMFINYRTPHRFTDNEIQDALQFANQAAVAIHNAQLHDEIRKRAEVMEGLYEAGKAITSTLSLEEVLTRISERALDIVGANPQEGCFSHVALLERNKLRFIAGFPLDILADLRQNVGEIDLEKDTKKGIVGRVVIEGQSENVAEMWNDPNWIPLSKGINIRSQLSVPLKIGERIIGVLTIEHPKPAAFGDEDVQNIELLAAQAVVAIVNAQLYGATTQQLAARTALAWTGMVSSTWRHAIEKHALTIREQIQLLRSDVAHVPQPDSLDGRLKMIERLANQILEKWMTPPLSVEEEAYSFPVNDLLRERTKQLWTNEPYKFVSLKLTLGLDDLATVRASPEWLRRALDILIDNAVEATTGLPERKIVIGSQRHDDYAEISIADNGRGISQDVLERLFREPIKKNQGTKGQGIGLLLAQMIVQTYRGTISCRDTGVAGTTMVISLPLEIA